MPSAMYEKWEILAISNYDCNIFIYRHKKSGQRVILGKKMVNVSKNVSKYVRKCTTAIESFITLATTYVCTSLSKPTFYAFPVGSR